MKFSRREVARAAGDQPLTVEEERRRNGAHAEHGTGGGRCARIETEKGDARVRRRSRLKGRGERATMRTMRARDADGGFPGARGDVGGKSLIVQSQHEDSSLS